MITGWIALKGKDSEYGEWCISPEDFFQKHGYIPDGHANLDVPGMKTIARHVLKACDGSDGRALLEAAGFKIIDDPVWYFDRERKT